MGWLVSMVPKGGFARLSLGEPGHRLWRRGSELTHSRASCFSSLLARRSSPVQIPMDGTTRK